MKKPCYVAFCNAAGLFYKKQYFLSLQAPLRRHCSWNIFWVLSVGDDVTAITGQDAVLTHTHLVVDGDTTQGASSPGKRIET